MSTSQSSYPDNPMQALLVIDRLQVGPLRLENKRLVMPYRVEQGDRSEQFDLIYSYEERVFDPEEPESTNLAAMIGAQAALNYGLFCREIVFHGPFDGSDRRFLRTMAENTSKEIYVKKFLEPNPFLQGAVSNLPVVVQKNYLQARLRFVDQNKGKARLTRWQRWPTDRHRHCILSSGGKDSLLSFGLMQEIVGGASQASFKGEVHPIFVNESGRHWFTALNAYRHFERYVPNTARVWVNSDRLFAWMLRRLPFIRSDFADVRSDEYPIRLWTVAVFLFGVLPLMRKRGIGRLLIGDEYDTTVQAIFQGIRHFDGLYDQSVLFDRAMSAYFMQKGWGVSQFSILRPLSELSIETILTKRFPELQKLQMSCHATSKQADRVVPCGRCEKCRRIVGMLTAIGADPQRCGYTEAQVQHCLQRLASGRIHQEAAGAEQLLYLLSQAKMIDLDGEAGPQPQERPEVISMRFDGECSPFDAIPLNLRAPLYRIYSQYTRGALLCNRGHWRAMDPLSATALNSPYPFESDIDQASSDIEVVADKTHNDYEWGQMTWPQMAQRLKNIDIALLPVGAIEQHGPHLPLDTDAYDADRLARMVAEACPPPKPLVLPAVPYGISYHHSDFKGTLSVGNESFSSLIYDIGMSVAANGIRKLIIINGHGGNEPALNYAAQRINRDAHIFVCVDSGETSDVDIAALIQTANDVHAGEIETSTSLATRPHLVRRSEAVSEVPHFSNRYLDFTSRHAISWYAYTDKISDSGVMGNPLLADAAKGERIWEIMVAHLVALVEDIKQMSLDEIHQRSV